MTTMITRKKIFDYLSKNKKLILLLVLTLVSLCFAIPIVQNSIIKKLMGMVLGRDLRNPSKWLTIIFTTNTFFLFAIWATFALEYFLSRRNLSLNLRSSIKNMFLYILIFFFAYSAVFSYFSNGENMRFYFHSDNRDSFMDFFNSVNYTPMVIHINNYPPLALVVYNFLARFCEIGDSLYLRTTVNANVLHVFTMLLFVVTMLQLLKTFFEKNNWSSKFSSVIAIAIIFSGPFFWAYERHNIINFALLFLFLFFMYKDDKNKYLRELALFFLAFSANLKYYPALFGIFLLTEKRFKEAFRCFLYGVILFVLSAAIFKFQVESLHPCTTGNLIQEIIIGLKTAFGFSNGYRGVVFNALILSANNLGYGVAKIIHHFNKASEWNALNIILPRVFVCLSFFFGLFAFFCCKKNWQKWFAVTMLIILCTGDAAGFYMLIFLTIPLVLYFVSNENNLFVTICFGIIFSFLAFNGEILTGGKYNLTLGYALVFLMLLLLFAYCIFDGMKAMETKRVRFAFVGILSFCLLFGVSFGIYQKNKLLPFEGRGTGERPYLIKSKSDLFHFSKTVNGGFSFSSCYFLQTEDIDLENENFIPIGLFPNGIFPPENYFKGTYDGGGHCIKNLLIYGEQNSEKGNVGLFGVLAGTVKNLGIESGYVSGACVGAIASHGFSDKAKIINCYNKATVKGKTRAGGICDNFVGGSVINCQNYGVINGIKNGPAISYNASYVEDVYPNVFPDTFDGMYDYTEVFKDRVFENKAVIFEGDGTLENPYLISSKKDLKKLSMLVNNGFSFAKKYFLQTKNIDLENEKFTPIGIFDSGKYFSGTYDGNNCHIKNIRIIGDRNSPKGNVGLFGVLAGTVKNLGIESGYVSGACIGTIASHGTINTKIINCYNKATVNGRSRAGGICDNLCGGIVINCKNFGRRMYSEKEALVISYDAGFVENIYPDVLPESFTGEVGQN